MFSARGLNPFTPWRPNSPLLVLPDMRQNWRNTAQIGSCITLWAALGSVGFGFSSFGNSFPVVTSQSPYWGLSTSCIPTSAWSFPLKAEHFVSNIWYLIMLVLYFIYLLKYKRNVTFARLKVTYFQTRNEKE